MSLTLSNIPQINADKLFAIAWRLVSNETVADVRDLVAKIHEAANIVVAAATRIAGIEDDGDRAIYTPEQAERINQVILHYHED